MAEVKSDKKKDPKTVTEVEEVDKVVVVETKPPAKKLKDKRDRHCAYCLDFVPAVKVQFCGGCKRRAYCSRECQVADWPSNKHKHHSHHHFEHEDGDEMVVVVEEENDGSQSQVGQGHKDWCGLKCGEEDLDWKVTQIEGKGLGIVALRPIPAFFRIMVEAGQCSPLHHPKTKDLVPEGATLEEKFESNARIVVEPDDPFLLFMRMSRLNHSCKANATTYYDFNHQVRVAFVDRDIEEGEEICILYQLPWTIVVDKPLSVLNTHKEFKDILTRMYGFACSADCFCLTEDFKEAIIKSRTLDSRIAIFMEQNRIDAALKKVHAMLAVHDEMKTSWVDKSKTLLQGFQLAVSQRNTLSLAQKFLDKLYEINCLTMHPKSENLRTYKMWKEDLSTAPFYLRGTTEAYHLRELEAHF